MAGLCCSAFSPPLKRFSFYRPRQSATVLPRIMANRCLDYTGPERHDKVQTLSRRGTLRSEHVCCPMVVACRVVKHLYAARRFMALSSSCFMLIAVDASATTPRSVLSRSSAAEASPRLLAKLARPSSLSVLREIHWRTDAGGGERTRRCIPQPEFFSCRMGGCTTMHSKLCCQPLSQNLPPLHSQDGVL